MKAEQKLQIHELLARAAYALDEHDLGLLGPCFAQDADLLIRIAGRDPAGPFDGHPAIMQLMRDSMAAQTDKRRHVISNIFFEDYSVDDAQVVSNLTLFATENGAIRLVCAGVYHDRVVRIDGHWCIASRCIDLDLPY